jgi:hypothetical protein
VREAGDEVRKAGKAQGKPFFERDLPSWSEVYGYKKKIKAKSRIEAGFQYF